MIDPTRMVDPTHESFFASKTMQLLCFCIGAIVLLIIVGVLVKVATGEDVFSLVAAGIASITGQSTAGVYRNVQVDGAVRQNIAAQGGVAGMAPVVPPPTPVQQAPYVMPSPPPPPP